MRKTQSSVVNLLTFSLSLSIFAKHFYFGRRWNGKRASFLCTRGSRKRKKKWEIWRLLIWGLFSTLHFSWCKYAFPQSKFLLSFIEDFYFQPNKIICLSGYCTVLTHWYELVTHIIIFFFFYPCRNSLQLLGFFLKLFQNV